LAGGLHEIPRSDRGADNYAVRSGGRDRADINRADSKPKLSQPSGLTKPQSGLRTKSFSAFGAGFVQVPDTDTCVKIGGFVTMEGTLNHGR